jgi:hypothetical protein
VELDPDEPFLPFLPSPAELGTVGELRALQQEAESRSRRLEHWRRLVAARLDLAVAAVADIDELPGHAPAVLPLPPYGLRELLGIGPHEHRMHETALLPRLKETLERLDAHLEALAWHRCEAGRLIAEQLDADAARHRAARTVAAVRASA